MQFYNAKFVRNALVSTGQEHVDSYLTITVPLRVPGKERVGHCDRLISPIVNHVTCTQSDMMGPAPPRQHMSGRLG